MFESGEGYAGPRLQPFPDDGRDHIKMQASRSAIGLAERRMICDDGCPVRVTSSHALWLRDGVQDQKPR